MPRKCKKPYLKPTKYVGINRLVGISMVWWWHMTFMSAEREEQVLRENV